MRSTGIATGETTCGWKTIRRLTVFEAHCAAPAIHKRFKKRNVGSGKTPVSTQGARFPSVLPFPALKLLGHPAETVAEWMPAPHTSDARPAALCRTDPRLRGDDRSTIRAMMGLAFWIPARAGMTSRPTSANSVFDLDPRSRGDDGLRRYPWSLTHSGSPLARG